MRMDCRISKNAKVAGCGLRFWKDGLPRRMLHARCYSKSGGDGRQDSDGDVDDFLPDFLFVHGCLVFLVLNDDFSPQSPRSLTEEFFLYPPHGT